MKGSKKRRKQAPPPSPAAAAFSGTSSEDGMEIEAPAPDATIAQGMA
jgi:hypothetical protein